MRAVDIKTITRIVAKYYGRRVTPQQAIEELASIKRKAAAGSLDNSGEALTSRERRIYKAAGYKAPAKGVRATVDDVVSGSVARGFDLAAYSTSWLYAS
jgi:hypothetical protein